MRHGNLCFSFLKKKKKNPTGYNIYRINSSKGLCEKIVRFTKDISARQGRSRVVNIREEKY